jgi:hypothetical protein
MGCIFSILDNVTIGMDDLKLNSFHNIVLGNCSDIGMVTADKFDKNIKYLLTLMLLTFVNYLHICFHCSNHLISQDKKNRYSYIYIYIVVFFVIC